MWAKPTGGKVNSAKELQVKCREAGETQNSEAKDADDSDDEFADAFEDATSVPANPVQHAGPIAGDGETQSDSYEEGTFTDEECETFTVVNPSEDRMAMGQMKSKLEFYRDGARRNPEEFPKKFINPNNQICIEYEASQRQTREVAKKAMEERRREPSTLPDPSGQ